MNRRKATLRTLLVTSEVTYVPSNYFQLFQTVLDGAGAHVAGLAILRGLNRALAKSTLGLFALGCNRVASTLVTNILRLPLKQREKLFRARNLPVLRWDSMNDAEAVEWVRANDIDLVINLRTRCIYKPDILNAPRLGCLNIHHGLLPVYRGTLCDLYALSENRPAGFTIHKMNEKIDAGVLYHVEATAKGFEPDYIGYLGKTGEREGRALVKLLDEIAASGALPDGQPNVCEKPIFTRNPKREQISQLKAKGMKL